jgi:hypothetical protein
MNSPVDKEVARLCLSGARSLGVRFTTPFTVTDIDGTDYTYLGVFHGFGAETGLLIACEEIPSGNSREREFAMSLLGPESVATVQQVRDLLSHSGWYGHPEGKPEWLER